MNKQSKIRLIKVISFWSLRRVKGLHLLTDYQLLKVALRKFDKSQVKDIIN